jgi:uncharacterized protein (TIGR02271 family)
MEPLKIPRGAEVRSADDAKLGTVSGGQGPYLFVEKGILSPSTAYIPSSAVASVQGGTVRLRVGKEQALASGWGQRPTAAATGTSGAATGMTASRAATAPSTEGEALRVPVHEEELTATKRPVERGQVEIEKDVVAEERTLDVPVTEERARVTRRTVDQEGAAPGAFQEGTIAVPLRGEEVDVAKRVRVAEEVDVEKEAVQQTKRVDDTVRREEVHVKDETTEASGSPPV